MIRVVNVIGGRIANSKMNLLFNVIKKSDDGKHSTSFLFKQMKCVQYHYLFRSLVCLNRVSTVCLRCVCENDENG